MDSLQAPQLGHSCDPPSPPEHAYPTPQTTCEYPNETLKILQKVLPLHVLNAPQTQSLVSIPYKLATWILCCKAISNSSHFLLSRAFLINFMSKTLSWRPNSLFKVHLDKPGFSRASFTLDLIPFIC